MSVKKYARMKCRCGFCMHVNTNILDFKLSPCSICSAFSFG